MIYEWMAIGLLISMLIIVIVVAIVLDGDKEKKVDRLVEANKQLRSRLDDVAARATESHEVNQDNAFAVLGSIDDTASEHLEKALAEVTTHIDKLSENYYSGMKSIQNLKHEGVETEAAQYIDQLKISVSNTKTIQAELQSSMESVVKRNESFKNHVSETSKQVLGLGVLAQSDKRSSKEIRRLNEKLVKTEERLNAEKSVLGTLTKENKTLINKLRGYYSPDEFAQLVKENTQMKKELDAIFKEGPMERLSKSA